MFDHAATPETALTVPATRLRDLCRQLAPACPTRFTIPVLGTVLVQSGPNGSTFTTTDLDLTSTVWADDIISPVAWSSCVPFALLRRLAATLDGPLRITFQKGGADGSEETIDRLTIATDDGLSATIRLLIPADSFPALPDDLSAPDGWALIDMTAPQLRRYLDLARPSISTEETRYYLNGIHLCQKPDGTTLRAVATNGYQMAVIDGPASMPEGISAIVPTIAVRALAQLINPRQNDPVTLMLHRTRPRVRAVCGDLRLDCKLIDGTFPDHTRLIPKAEPVATLALTAASLRRLVPLTTERSQAVKFADGKATLRSPDGNAISIPAPMAVEPDTVPVEIAFNVNYLAAQARVTPTFRMAFTGPSHPATIHGEDPDAMWVLMPMRV